MKTHPTLIIREPAHELPVPPEQTADVIVCGGGPAGIAAALAAARSGAQTVLIETHGCLGGVWTAGLVAWIVDGDERKPGIMRELKRRLEQRGACRHRVPTGRNFACDVEPLKLLLEEMVAEAGVRVRYHTRVAAVAHDPQDARRVAAVITESKSGRQAWTARCFVDATGDGDLAAHAGCGFDFGRAESPGETQPMSLLALVTGVRMQDIEPFVGGGLSEPKQRLLAELQRAGVTPSYTAPTLYPLRDDLFSFMAVHEYGASALDADAVTRATFAARAEVNRLVDALRSLGHPWANLRVTATAEHIGVREGRRIHALYTVTKDDALRGLCHNDGVCRVTAPFDIHTTDERNKHRPYDAVDAGAAQHYDIPLRSLIAADADNLLLAGRCIGGDFEAHSSYRVTGNAVATGQAAGIAAALAAHSERAPKSLPWCDVKSALDALIAQCMAPSA